METKFKTVAFWNVTPCILIVRYEYYRVTPVRVKMEEEASPETSVSITTPRLIPEYRNLIILLSNSTQTHRHE